MQNLVTKESFNALVNRGDSVAIHAIGRCLVNLLNRQTQNESRDNMTKVHNNIGFTPADAKSGSITAKYYIKNGTLLDWQIEKWMKPGANGYPRIVKYWRQMNEVANQKRAA